MKQDSVTRKYRGVANMFAMLVLATDSFTQLDRLANALSPEVVTRVVYDVMRSIDVLKRRPEVSIKEAKEGSSMIHRLVLKEDGKKREYQFWGGLAHEELMENFIEDSTIDLTIARKIAALAMSSVAIQSITEEARKTKGVKS